MDVLEKIFGSAAKVKIMRLFLFNPNSTFDMERIIRRTRVTPQAAHLNVRLLESIKLIRPKIVVVEESVPTRFSVATMAAATNGKNSKGKKGKNGKNGKLAKAARMARPTRPARVIAKKRVQGWMLNGDFIYLLPLQSFLINMSPLQDGLIIRKFNRTGKVRLLVVSGVFMHEKDSRVDILIVGDSIRKNAVEGVVKEIEAELGKEIAYSVFETRDFNYRIGMYDKLIRDILDYPHRKLVNKLGV